MRIKILFDPGSGKIGDCLARRLKRLGHQIPALSEPGDITIMIVSKLDDLGDRLQSLQKRFSSPVLIMNCSSTKILTLNCTDRQLGLALQDTAALANT